jgi:type II secretory pathway component PulF
MAIFTQHSATQGGTSASAASSQVSHARKPSGYQIDFGPSRKDILNFTNQLAVMIRAGISLQDALESIGTQISRHCHGSEKSD